MPDDKSISELTTAPDITADTLVEVATPDVSSDTGYSSYKGILSTIFDKILNTFQFTQRLNTTNKTVFGAINELEAGGGGGGGGDSVSWSQVVVSGTKIATITINNVPTDVYAPDGGGNTDYVELTQAEYDALEQAGQIDPTVLYFITDGQSGNEIIDDTTTSASKVWSSYKTDNEISAVSSDLVSRINGIISNSTTSSNKTWSSQKISDELDTKQDDLTGEGLSNVDLDNYKSTKLYWITTTGITNAPVNTYGILRVSKVTATIVLQEYIVFAGDQYSNRGDSYRRTYANGQWYGWQKITTVLT